MLEYPFQTKNLNNKISNGLSRKDKKGQGKDKKGQGKDEKGTKGRKKGQGIYFNFTFV